MLANSCGCSIPMATSCNSPDRGRLAGRSTGRLAEAQGAIGRLDATGFIRRIEIGCLEPSLFTEHQAHTCKKGRHYAGNAAQKLRTALEWTDLADIRVFPDRRSSDTGHARPPSRQVRRPGARSTLSPALTRKSFGCIFMLGSLDDLCWLPLCLGPSRQIRSLFWRGPKFGMRAILLGRSRGTTPAHSPKRTPPNPIRAAS